MPLKFDWDGWKRQDWDGQRLLELFHEFGFRGFAERVRKTLAASGAKKNAEVLAAAGVTSGRTPTVRRGGRRCTASLTVGARRHEETGEPRASSTRSTASEEASDPHRAARRRLEVRRLRTRRHARSVRRASSTKLKKQKRFVFDLETTGLDPISRRDRRLRVLLGEGTAYYLPVRGPEDDKTLDPAATLAALKPIFENPKVAKVNQNIKYDQIVLRRERRRRSRASPATRWSPTTCSHPASATHGLDDLTLDLPRPQEHLDHRPDRQGEEADRRWTRSARRRCATTPARTPTPPGG